jgi:hypothetical protein
VSGAPGVEPVAGDAIGDDGDGALDGVAVEEVGDLEAIYILTEDG